MGLAAFFFRNLVYYPVARYQAGPVRRYGASLARTQFASRGELARLQMERLSALIAHASARVPFHAGRLPEVSATDDVQAVLAQLPFLQKQDLQSRADDLRSRPAPGKLVSKTTGGSTGEPVTVWKTRDAWAWELAATWRGYSWAGIEAGDLQARFWGVPQQAGARWRARAIDTVCHRIRIPAFSFSEEDMKRYVAVLDRRRPRFFYGYVSMLTEFARFLQRTGRKLGFAPTAVVTTSEVLSAADRDLLREIFGAPVFNEYGCGELGTIAHECPAGSLHLSEENMAVEICDGDRRCLPGESGEIVVTELNSQGFPLIRYRMGDYGTIAPDPCSCGRTLAVLGSVQGRAYDFVRNRQGQLFHGEFIMYIFEELRRRGAGIKQFQFEQVDLDAFTVRIVRGADYDAASEDFVVARIRGDVDPAAKIDFEYVTAIERERSGKMRLIKGLGA